MQVLVLWLVMCDGTIILLSHTSSSNPCALLSSVGLSYELLYHQGLESLLRREVEKAMEKLDLTWDRACAWDMFEHMMVRPFQLLRSKHSNPRCVCVCVYSSKSDPNDYN